MYVSLTIIYLGEAFIFKAGWPAVLLPLLLVYLNWVVIPVEEKRLALTFGRDYEVYSRQSASLAITCLHGEFRSFWQERKGLHAH